MYIYFVYPFPSANLFLRAIEFRAPLIYRGAFYSYTAMLFATPYIFLSILLSGLYIFALKVGRRAKPSQLPPYPDPRLRRDLSLVIGEVHTSTILTLIVIPVIYQMWRRWQMRRAASSEKVSNA